MMKVKKNKIFLLLLLLFISIGFAYLSTNLIIQGRGIFSENSWDIYFDNLKEENYKANIITPASISNKVTINSSINLEQPQSTYTMYANIVNDGTIDAMLDSWTITNNLDSDEAKVIDLKVTYFDDIQLNKNDLLLANSFDTIKVTAIYKDDISNSELLNTTGSINLAITLNYIQADDDAIERAYRYNIKYVLNDGVIANNPVTYTTKEQVNLPNPTRDGYTFKGWTVGKNLFLAPAGLSSEGINSTINQDGSIDFSGTSTSSWANITPIDWTYSNLNYSFVKAGTYTISYNNLLSTRNWSGITVKGGIQKNKQWQATVQYGFTNNPATFTVADGYEYWYYLFISTGGTGNIISGKINVQVEEGTKATEFEPYISTPTKNIIIPIGSAGNRTYVANWEKN